MILKFTDKSERAKKAEHTTIRSVLLRRDERIVPKRDRFDRTVKLIQFCLEQSSTELFKSDLNIRC